MEDNGRGCGCSVCADPPPGGHDDDILSSLLSSLSSSPSSSLLRSGSGRGHLEAETTATIKLCVECSVIFKEILSLRSQLEEVEGRLGEKVEELKSRASSSRSKEDDERGGGEGGPIPAGTTRKKTGPVVGEGQDGIFGLDMGKVEEEDPLLADLLCHDDDDDDHKGTWISR